MTKTFMFATAFLLMSTSAYAAAPGAVTRLVADCCAAAAACCDGAADCC